MTFIAIKHKYISVGKGRAAELDLVESQPRVTLFVLLITVCLFFLFHHHSSPQ